jgi:hypothetical protein
MGEMGTAGLRVRPPGPFDRSLSGHIYRITDAGTFFAPILSGQRPPPEGYEPWAGLEVRTWSVNDLFPIPFPGGTARTQADGGFNITQTPPNPTLGSGAGQPSDIRFSLLVSEDSFPYRPLYRSDLSLTVEAAETSELNVWLLTVPVDVNDGISAGDVSGVLGKSGLPGNTHITASPSGLGFAGSDSGANINFGISITPDTSFDLNTLLDLHLSSWNIDVGWPADWCTNADDILVEIVRGLQDAGSSMNASVLTKLETIFSFHENLPASVVRTFFESDASVTFMDLTFPTQHTWPLYTTTWPLVTPNTTDSTVVVTGDLCIGYPRHLSWDPSKIPVFEAVRLSRPLRPVRL